MAQANLEIGEKSQELRKQTIENFLFLLAFVGFDSNPCSRLSNSLFSFWSALGVLEQFVSSQIK